MSFAEVKERVKELTPEELDDLALHVEFLRRTNDPAWQQEMARRAQAAAAGAELHSMEEVEALHRRLIAEGR